MIKSLSKHFKIISFRIQEFIYDDNTHSLSWPDPHYSQLLCRIVEIEKENSPFSFIRDHRDFNVKLLSVKIVSFYFKCIKKSFFNPIHAHPYIFYQLNIYCSLLNQASIYASSSHDHVHRTLKARTQTSFNIIKLYIPPITRKKENRQFHINHSNDLYI